MHAAAYWCSTLAERASEGEGGNGLLKERGRMCDGASGHMQRALILDGDYRHYTHVVDT